VTFNRAPTMFDSRSDHIICSAPLFRAGFDKLSVVICVNLCPFAVPINLPEDENYYPHPEALEWHKKEVFNKFSL
jgi:hypothetical protein